MPPARHRLDLLLLREGGPWPASALGRLRAAGFDAELFHAEAERFLSNRQGGFHVRCPRTGEGIARPFARAVEAWRAGGARRLDCPCGQAHDLAELAFDPPAAFARDWIELHDVDDAELPAELAAALGPHRRLWRRG